MRILLVNKFIFPKGGAETYTFDVGKMLEEHGHEVQYFGLENEKNTVGNRIGSYVTNMDFSQGIKANLNAPFRIIYSREARKKIRAVLDDFQPDVVHLNNIQYHLTPSIILETNKWRKETRKECKIVYTTHDYQLVCPSHGIISCASSRYITGITYDTILKIIDYDKKYVVIGKPCDIEALINYTNLDEKMKKCIKYTMTFFCAGAPSKNATLKLAENLGVQADQIESVRYRGNGWPGKATVTLKDKSERHMDYIDSWNQILGRNIRKMCKFCVNGVGMYADISCGDLWNLDQNQRPEFTEGKGQNIIFARSKAGSDLLTEARDSGYIHMEDYTKMDDLKYIQPNHFNMQTTMIGKIIGLKLCTVCGGAAV